MTPRTILCPEDCPASDLMCQRNDDASTSPAIVTVEISVTDCGCGISAADAGRLFEAFEQARRAGIVLRTCSV
jgi:signal transduction histidine kinase